MSFPARSIVGSFAVLSALGLWSSLAAGCGSKGAAPETSGERLYASQGCVTCHGPRGEGTALAPALSGAGSRWTRDALIEYLHDPRAYAAKDPRLSAQGGRYSLPMPSYAMLTRQDLERLASFVLELR